VLRYFPENPMPSKIHKRGLAKVSMNMTPLIDVTFQLILFFMLINNIASDESIKLKVPQLDDPKTQELGEVSRVIVSVASGNLDYNDDERDKNPLASDPRARIISIGGPYRWDILELGLD